jgi:hypothetical protein
MDSAQYKHVVLGLIFLKYASDTCMMRLDELATFAANLHPPAAEHITAGVPDALSGTASDLMTHLEAG